MSRAIRLWSRLWIAIFLLTASCGALADKGEASVFSPQGTGIQSLTPFTTYLEDDTGALTIADIAGGRVGEFRAVKSISPTGFSNKVFWLKIPTDMTRFNEPYWFLVKDFIHVRKISVFSPSDNGFSSMEIDADTGPNGRNLLTPDFLIKIPSTKSLTTYYVRVDPGNHVLNLDFSWGDVSSVIKDVNKHQLWSGLFFGSLLVMLLYNGFLFFYTRDFAYLYYLYYLTCFIFVFVDVKGLASLVLKHTPAQATLVVLCLYGSQHGAILFVRKFLNLREAIPWGDRLLQSIQWLLIIGVMATFFLPYAVAFKIVLASIPIALISTQYFSFYRWLRHKYEPARIYLFGWFAFGIPSIAFTLQKLGFVHSTALTTYGIQVGAVWEVVLSSLALGYRIKLLEAEKEAALVIERAKLENLVAVRTTDLQASLEMRRRLVATASHELRTPVNALRLLADSATLSDDANYQLRPRVLVIAKHMAELIERLLLLDPDSKMTDEHGLVENFYLEHEISAIAELTTPLRNSTKLLLNLSACAGVAVRGDRSALRRITINLLTNAFKFAEGGTVSLSTRVDQNSDPEKIWCSISVSDDGPGIPKSQQDRLFEAYATNRRTANAPAGTGLGLHISRKLATAMGGELRLISAEEQVGSTFECTIPLDRSTQESKEDLQSKPQLSAEERRQSKIHKSKLSVLVAEDDPLTAEAIQLIIRSLGHNVVHVATCEDLATTLIDKPIQYDLALIDNQLRDGTGLDVVRRYRSRVTGSSMRLVLMTANATKSILDEAKTVFDDVVIKPTTADCIRRQLGEEIPHALANNAQYASDLLDATPLSTLRQSGLEDEALLKLFELFRTNFNVTLEEIEPLLSPPLFGTTSERRNNIIHRLTSACATMGAAALTKSLRELSVCDSSESARLKFEDIEITFAMTNRALFAQIRNDQ